MKDAQVKFGAHKLVQIQFKGYGAPHNITYKLSDFKQILDGNEMTADKWCHCGDYVIKEQDKLMLRGNIYIVVDNLIINTADSVIQVLTQTH